MRTNDARAVLARAQEPDGEVVIHATTQQYKLINKEQSQISLAPSSLFMLKVNQGLHEWAPDQNIALELQQIGQYLFFMHLGPSLVDHNLVTLDIDR